MNIFIIRPQRENRNEIHNLFRSVITDAFKQDGLDDPNGIQEEVEKQMGFLNQDFETNGLDVFFLIARTEEQIVGTIAYSKANDLIREHLKIDLQNVPEITTVYILPEFQGKGIGS